MRWSKAFLATTAVCVCAGVVPPVCAAGIQQAFLVQNSGWMEPFYSDPASKIKPLVAAVASAVASADDTVFTLAFSQSSVANVSPKLLGKAQGPGALPQQLANLAVARKGSGLALADTDFQEAVSKTITGPFAKSSGILWIFTNNKNSPNNDTQTADRNRDFYRLLHLDSSITKTLVFPLRMPVQGKLFAARGLMVYALAYGPSAAAELDRIMAAGQLSRVLTAAPARLKPIDQDAVRIVPEKMLDSQDIRASLASDQRTVVLDVNAANIVSNIRMQASLQNLFYPYVIKTASVDAALVGSTGRTAVSVKPTSVSDLQPAGKESVEVSFALPMEQVPSLWSSQALAAMGKRVLLPLTVEIGLSGQRLALSDSFIAEMRDLFPGDPISEVFTPPEEVRASKVRVPLLVRIQYPLTPVLALIAAALLLVAGFVTLAVLGRRTSRYDVMVDGVKRSVSLKPFATLAIKDDEGRLVGRIRRSAGIPAVIAVEAGRTLTTSRR